MEALAIEMGGMVVRGMDDLLVCMHDRLSRFDAARDNRAAFLRVYATMTADVRSKLAGGVFLDPPWIERVAIRFTAWYFDALDRFDRGDRPPPAWHRAFEVAERREGFVLQDALLGMNAHINNDLPQVVASILSEEGDEGAGYNAVRRRFDHDQINRVLEMVIPTVETELAGRHGRLIRPLGLIMGRLDQSLASYGLKSWRDAVWRNAQFLLAAEHEQERGQVTRFIEADALAVANQIMNFPVLRALRPLAPLARRWRLC